MDTLVKNGMTFNRIAPGVYMVVKAGSKGKASGIVRRQGDHRHVWNGVTMSNRSTNRNFRTMTEAAEALTSR